MAFYVIEGDNGTGKDSIALKLAEEGFTILSAHPEIKEHEKAAKLFQGKARTEAFLHYNEICGNLADKFSQDSKSKPLLLRYWISTLAAAYCDCNMSYEQVMKLASQLVPQLKAPVLLIRIFCSHKVRAERIAKRGPIEGAIDDKSIRRSEKYEWISKELLSASGYTWIEVDNSHKTVEQVVKEIKAIIATQTKA